MTHARAGHRAGGVSGRRCRRCLRPPPARGGPRSGALRSVALHALRSCLSRGACRDGAGPEGRLLRAWAGGAGYFALTLHWIVEPFMVDAARHGWMAPFALVLFAGGLALFWAAAGWAAVRLRTGPVARALAFAPAPDPGRGGAGHGPDGLSLGLSGTRADRHALACCPALAGAHGLTLLVTGAVALGQQPLASRAWPVAVAALAVMFGALRVAFPRTPAAAADAPVMRLIQPNAPQHLKWQPDMIPVFWQRGPGPDRGAPIPSLARRTSWSGRKRAFRYCSSRSDAARVQLAVAAGGAPVLIGAQRWRVQRRATPRAGRGRRGARRGL
jgi:apolipoprotein N-acyltransferase